MTVALVLAGEADAGLCGQLAALGARRVDAAERAGPGLLTVAAAARAADDRLLICVGADTVPEPVLAALLAAGGTAAFTGMNDPVPDAAPARRDPGPGALAVSRHDLDALALAAESLAATHPGPPTVGVLIYELARRGVTVRVLDAGPDAEGAVARLAEPAARDVARWAAWRQLGAGALYGFSLALGLVAAVWFSELAVRAKLLGAVALAGAFLAARAGSLLAAASPSGRVKPAVAWLGAACALLTEFAVYAALAVSSGVAPGPGNAAGLTGIFGGALQHTAAASWAGPGQDGIWRLAIAAILVVGIRRMAGLGYEQAAQMPASLSSRSVVHTLGQAAALPLGERYGVIVATAILFGPRVTFLVLLAWGVVAAGCVLAGQIARSGTSADTDETPARTRSRLTAQGSALAAYRGDGPVSRWLGRLGQGRLPPLPPLLVGLFVTCVLAALGLQNLPGILVLTPAEAMMLAALGARHPHNWRADWLVPALLLAGEGVYFAALGLSHQVAAWLVFALLAAVIIRHVDLAYRARVGLGIPADVAGLGWDGRMLLAGLAAVAGLTPIAYAVMSVYLWLLLCRDFLGGWLGSADGDDVEGMALDGPP